MAGGAAELRKVAGGKHGRLSAMVRAILERCCRCEKRAFYAALAACDVCGVVECARCRRRHWASVTVCSSRCSRRRTSLERANREFPPAVRAE